jgi:hypothetical protein
MPISFGKNSIYFILFTSTRLEQKDISISHCLSYIDHRYTVLESFGFHNFQNLKNMENQLYIRL